MRIQLKIDSTAAVLHRLYWETLLDPQEATPLGTRDDFIFSRFPISSDMRSVRQRMKSELKALAVVANPSNLGEYQLAPIEVEAELERARRGLAGVAITPFSGSAGRRVTLDNLIAALRETDFDIVYLVCHGKLQKGESWLYLENEEGKVKWEAGNDLAQRMGRLTNLLPRLVVLASCESAGSTAGPALASLGPRLAEAGIPAVLAMQGEIGRDTLAVFMEHFFEELDKEEGRVDAAVAAGRRAVKDQPDWWMPVLFSRLIDGRLWYDSGFANKAAFERWPSLIDKIMDGECTPILGPGTLEPLLGSYGEIARRWAEKYDFPMYPHESESLPLVAQYLEITQEAVFPRKHLIKHLVSEIQDRFRDELPASLLQRSVSLEELFQAIGELQRRRHPWDTFKVLAELPLRLYITTNYGNLLESALRAVGKEPRSVSSPWNSGVLQTELLYQTERDWEPDPDHPLVYHLFGRFVPPDSESQNLLNSVVLTEDDYFKYLIKVTENRDFIPSYLRYSLNNTTLLFLGFSLTNWNFRVVLQSLLTSPGSETRRDHMSVAVQIEPDANRLIKPQKAREYLEQYFEGEAKKIFLYWGNSDEFTRDLMARMSTSGGR
jgi:hypothetical protein